MQNEQTDCMSEDEDITDEEYFLELNAGARLVGAPATYGVGVRTTF